MRLEMLEWQRLTSQWHESTYLLSLRQPLRVVLFVDILVKLEPKTSSCGDV
jgi:hypothetical protein